MFSSPRCDTSGGYDFSADLDAFDDMAGEIAEVDDAKAVPAAASLVFCVRQHDHNPVLAFNTENP